MQTGNTTTETVYQRPPWPAAVAALIAFATLAISSGATVPLAALGVGLLVSYIFAARFENVTLTKWTLRIIVIGFAVFGYLLSATKDENAFLDMRYAYSFTLGAASELTLQFWRREPTGGPRGPLTVLLSALIFVTGCTATDETYHYIWYLAPAYFLFLTLSLPSFQPRAIVPLGLTLLPVLAALGLGGVTHAEFYLNRGALNALGAQGRSSHHLSVSMGMSGQPILGSSFTLQDSLARVLRVQNLGDDSYLHGMTFDTYSGRAWGPPLEQRPFVTYHPVMTNSGSAEQAHVLRLDDEVSLLFAPLHSAAIRPDGHHALEWSKSTDGPLRTPPATVDSTSTSDSLSYDIVPHRGTVPQGLFDAPPTPEEEKSDLVIPREIDARVIAKARKIGSRLTDSQDKIEAVVMFLHQNNHYSLTVDPGPGDPISNFILARKAAHCEYFASAAVVLLRAIGVPTRYASGYFAHEADGKGWTLVRQRDAHAWAESWVPGTGWVTVDATPGGGRPDALARPIPFWWRCWEWMQDALGALRRWVVEANWAQKGAVFGILVLGLLIPQLYRYWQRRRQATPGFQYSRPDAALAMFAVRFESLLDRRGQPCPEGRTWPEHLRRMEEEKNKLTAWETFVRDYCHARFGESPGPREIAQIDSELRVLEDTVKKEMA